MIKNKNTYTFPFNTCEIPNKKGISQPYSVFFNFISCLIILYYLLITTNFSSKLLLFSILLFELFHTFCHSIHLHNYSQIIITHLLAYFVNFCYLFALYNYSNKIPNNYTYFSKDIKSKIPLIFILTLFILLLFINESYNCKKMLNKYKWFPFHILIEITAIFLVYNICTIFSKL